MSRRARFGPWFLGIVIAASAACRGPETLRSPDGRPGQGNAGSGGTGGSGGGGTFDAAGGTSGQNGDDGGSGGDGGNGGDGGAGGGSGGGGGSAGSGGAVDAPVDQAVDVPRDMGIEQAADVPRDMPTDEAAAPCVTTANCYCEYFAGRAYKFCGTGLPFQMAQADCVAQGMRLIRLDDAAENQWAYDRKVARGFGSTWIGASDGPADGDEGNWRWVDGTSFWRGRGAMSAGMAVGGLFNAWQAPSDEPNQNGNEDCAGYWYPTDRWADLTCTDHCAYICETY